MWLALGRRRTHIRGGGRHARLRRSTRARRNRAEVQSVADCTDVIVDINGARIACRRAGAGFPILMFHAGIADSRMWQPQADEFAKQFDVIRPDMRGFGDSELPPRRWSPVGDVIALMDELGLKPAHLIGCSLGGRLAIDLAPDHPARGSKLALARPPSSGDRFGQKSPAGVAGGTAAS